MPINPGIMRHAIRPHPTPPCPPPRLLPLGRGSTSRRGQDMVRLRIRYLGRAERRPWKGAADQVQGEEVASAVMKWMTISWF